MQRIVGHKSAPHQAPQRIDSFAGVTAANSLMQYAPNLTRPLLLVHGTADDNVHFLHTLKLGDALFRAGRRFEMLPLAGQTHQVGADAVVRLQIWRRVFDFFHENL